MEDRRGDAPGRGRRHHGHRGVLLQLRGDRVLRGRASVVIVTAPGIVQHRGHGQRAIPVQVGWFFGDTPVQVVRRVRNTRSTTQPRRPGKCQSLYFVDSLDGERPLRICTRFILQNSGIRNFENMVQSDLSFSFRYYIVIIIDNTTSVYRDDHDDGAAVCRYVCRQSML